MIILGVIAVLIGAYLAWILFRQNRRAKIQERLEWSRDRFEHYDNRSHENEDYMRRMRSEVWYDRERWQ
jgi:hypothetical protein